MTDVLNYKTIQSSSRKEFDIEINEHLKYGYSILPDGVSIIKNEGGILYSQVIVYENKKNNEAAFYDNGQMKYYKPRNDAGDLHGNLGLWYRNGKKKAVGC